MSAMDYSGPERRRGGPDRRGHRRDHAGSSSSTTTPCSGWGSRNILGREPDFEIVGRGRGLAERDRPRHRDLARHHPDGPLAAGARRHRDDPADQARAALDRRSSCSPSARTRTRCSTRSRPAPPRSSSRTSARTTWSRSSAASSPASTSSTTRSSPSRPSPRRVLKEFRELAVYGQEAAPIFAPLSPREVEILDNIAQGMTNKQVAYALSISEQTVKNHMSSILRKLSVNDRTQAVVYAMRQGWIRMPED